MMTSCALGLPALAVLMFATALGLVLYCHPSWYGWSATPPKRARNHDTCTTKDEKAICVFTDVCYEPPDDEATFHHSVYINSDHEKPSRGPVAYLIAPDIFPQSGLYIHYRPAAVTKPDAYVEDDTFVFVRFKPDNLMHFLHDNLLPTYAVLAEVYGTLAYPYDTRILLVDDYGEMPFDRWLQALSRFPLSAIAAGERRCFRQLIAGFDKSSLWYQYGFTRPQGPLPHDGAKIRRLIASLFLRPVGAPSAPSQIALLSRGETRRILNEAELSSALAKHFLSRVVTVDLDTHSLSEVAEQMSRAELAIGMHGALLTAMVWLPPNATVLELFPHAVPPARYTPYRTLASIIGLKYIFWRNAHRENSVGHIDYPKEYGGLTHLPPGEQREIVEQETVPAHLCCDNPSWLYHIYQDTHVTVDEIIDLLHQLDIVN